MNPVSCRIEGNPWCPCKRPLFWRSDSFTGSIEIKCPSCKRTHTFGDSPVSHDIRCNNSFKGKGLGGWCGRLIMRISADWSGALQYKCASCKEIRTVRIDHPAMTAST